MSFALTEKVLNDATITDISEFAVMLVLAHCHNKNDGRCFPSADFLSAKARITRRSVFYVLGRLEQKGYIKRESGSGSRKSNRYELYPGIVHALHHSADGSVATNGANRDANSASDDTNGAPDDTGMVHLTTPNSASGSTVTVSNSKGTVSEPYCYRTEETGAAPDGAPFSSAEDKSLAALDVDVNESWLLEIEHCQNNHGKDVRAIILKCRKYPKYLASGTTITREIIAGWLKREKTEEPVVAVKAAKKFEAKKLEDEREEAECLELVRLKAERDEVARLKAERLAKIAAGKKKAEEEREEADRIKAERIKQVETERLAKIAADKKAQEDAWEAERKRPRLILNKLTKTFEMGLPTTYGTRFTFTQAHIDQADEMDEIAV